MQVQISHVQSFGGGAFGSKGSEMSTTGDAVVGLGVIDASGSVAIELESEL